MGAISNFYQGATKKFTVTCKIGGTAQDVTSDTVVFYMKTNKSDTDADAAILNSGDTVTQGSSGDVLFALSPTETDVTPGEYYCDVKWNTSGGDEHIAYDGVITVRERVSDV